MFLLVSLSAFSFQLIDCFSFSRKWSNKKNKATIDKDKAARHDNNKTFGHRLVQRFIRSSHVSRRSINCETDKFNYSLSYYLCNGSIEQFDWPSIEENDTCHHISARKADRSSQPYDICLFASFELVSSNRNWSSFLHRYFRQTTSTFKSEHLVFNNNNDSTFFSYRSFTFHFSQSHFSINLSSSSKCRRLPAKSIRSFKRRESVTNFSLICLSTISVLIF